MMNMNRELFRGFAAVIQGQSFHRIALDLNKLQSNPRQVQCGTH